jgi:GcrA cell cycle regulator
MSWTDDRIEVLRKLWLEGSSASQIAKELANGVTRNAVIGKVHRLGLSGRVKSADAVSPIEPAISMLKFNAPQISPPHGQQKTAKPMAQHPMARPPQMTPILLGNIALALEPKENIPASPAQMPIAIQDIVTPISERVTLAELRDSMCRWPLGDPAHPEFRFCGGRKRAGEGPYCAHHAEIAYQPQHDRRRERRLLKAG